MSRFEDSIRYRATEPLMKERLVLEVDVQLTLLEVVGPETWKAFFLEGYVQPYGVLRGGKILIGLAPDDPIGALAWFENHDEKMVHHLWVDAEARRKGVAQLLFALYKKHVTPRLVAVGPFTVHGMRAAKRAGARLEDKTII